MASADGAPLGSSGRIGRKEARCALLDSKLPDAGGNADGEHGRVIPLQRLAASQSL